MVVIKVTNGLETRRLQVTSGEITFEQLKEKLVSSFPGEVSADKPLSLQYKDSDGDVITISSDTEFQGALSDLVQESILKLHIQTKPVRQVNSRQRARPAHHSTGSSFFDVLFNPGSTNVWNNFDKQFRHTEALLQQLWGKDCCKEASETIESKETTKEAVTGSERKTEPDPSEAHSQHDSDQPEAPATEDDDTVKSKLSDEPEKKKDSPAVRHRTYVAWEPRIQHTWFGPRAVLRPVTYNVLSCEWSSEDQKTSPQEATAQ